MKDNIKNNKIKWTIISSILFCLGIAFTLNKIIISDNSFTTISSYYSADVYTRIYKEDLLKGDIISGEFRSKENNLGIVEIHFITHPRVRFEDEDEVIFRIKEKGNKNWYYENKYKAGFFYDTPDFPFGFKKIADSQGKIYEFQVESLNGNGENSVSINNLYPALVAKYESSKADLLGNKGYLLLFLGKKIYYSFQNYSIILVSLMYFAPFFYYQLYSYISSRHKIMRNQNQLFLFSFLIYDIIINIDYSYLILGGIILFWIFIIKKDNIRSSRAFFYALYIWLLSSILSLVDYQIGAEKAGIWTFIFFVTGTLLLISESKKIDEKK